MFLRFLQVLPSEGFFLPARVESAENGALAGNAVRGSASGRQVAGRALEVRAVAGRWRDDDFKRN